MRLRFLLPVVALLAAAGTAEAGIRDIFKTKAGLPKPISLVNERVDRSSGAAQGVFVNHPPQKYSAPEWGARFDQIMKSNPPRPVSPPLTRSEY